MGRLWLLMVSAFQYGKVENTTGRLKYSTPGAMEQAGVENMSVPWATTVLPAIWNNVETMGDLRKSDETLNRLTDEAISRGEEHLSVEELNAKYPHMHFEVPQYAATAQHMAERQSRMQELEWLKQHSSVKVPGTLLLPELGSYIAKSFTDPTELALMVGTALATEGLGLAFPSLAKFSGTGLMYKMAGKTMPANLLQAQLKATELPLSARLTGRFTQGFVEEAFANALVEPWVAETSIGLGDDYTAMNSAMNVFVGGLTGAAFHTIGGAIADPFMKKSVTERLKETADYVALRANGEDGIMAAAQGSRPVTSLSAMEVFSAKNVQITQLPNGQYVARFSNDTGLLGLHNGITGRTPGDAIRNLQYMYSTKMNDPVLFNQLNQTYGTVTPAKEAGKITNPFSGESKIAKVRHTTTVRKGQNKYKLDFESPADRVFYAINKILNYKKNRGKDFSKITEGKEELLEALTWITENLGDATEADIRSHAKQVSAYINKTANQAFAANDTSKAIKIPAIVKASDFYVHPEFLSTEAWTQRLNKQKEILLGTDREAAIDLLGEIYSADREMYKARIESMKAARSEVQKLINTTEDQLKQFTKRDLARKEIADSIKAATKHITDEQLTQYLYMLDIVTGDFAKWVEDNNISFVATKDQQAQTETRLKQTVIERKSKRKNIDDPLQFYKAAPEEILDDSFTVSETALYGNVIDAVIEAKTGKYDLQSALKQDLEDLSDSDQQMLEGLDYAVEHSHLKSDTRLFRGLTRRETLAVLGTDIKPGMVIQSKGFLGTSFDEMQADRFASAGQTDEGRAVLLEVRAPKGSYALDVDAAIALNHKNSLKHNWSEQIAKAETIDDLESPEFDDVLFGDADDLTFTLGVMEGEVILPREMALKVLEVKQEGNQQRVIVTPDATLNNIYGNNVFRDNVDLFFNKVQEMNSTYKTQLEQLQIGTPEHKAIATEAFYNGYILSDEVINAYPDLRIAKDLTQAIPGEWLLQATNKESLANRIVGEFIQDMTPENFQAQYCYNYVYSLGDGRFTKSPALAMEKTGKAVLYEIGAGPRYTVDFDGPLENVSMVVSELLKWEPAIQNFLNQNPEMQLKLVQKLAIDALNWKNTSGITFLDYLDAMNLTNRKQIKKQTMWSRLSINDNEIIYPLQNIPGEVKQIGEVKLFEGMPPERMDQIDGEAIYKSLMAGEITKVEDLQTEVLKLEKEKRELEVQRKSTEAQPNQLDKQIETQAKKITKTKKEVEKAKKDREKVINNVNKKSEPYNTVVKGAVDVGTEGRYIVSLFQNADISTLVHETAHIFRRTVLDSDLLEQAEAALGVKNGKWTVKNEEDFARAFERYLAEGKAPAKGLEAMFEAFKSWLTQIYIKLTQSPMEQDFSPEIRKVFDELFAEERVNMAESRSYTHESVTKQMYQNALTQHKDTLSHLNKSIKEMESAVKSEPILDQATFEKFRQEKLERIQSKLNMLAAPEELTQTQIHDKMKDISAEVRRAENEYAKVADNQFQKNQEFKATDATFYETELTLAQEGLMTYAKTLGLTEEQISILLEESGLGTDDLRLSVLDEEAMANEILEGALHEFGNCARGEL